VVLFTSAEIGEIEAKYLRSILSYRTESAVFSQRPRESGAESAQLIDVLLTG
jgi:hypothetical protein